MRLTGKAKEDFLKWLSKTKWKDTADRNEFYIGFNRLTESMQWGVFQDFFQSKDFYFDLEPHLGGGQPVYYGGVQWRDEDFVDRFEAIKQGEELHYNELPKMRKEVLKKANEIYNSVQ